MLSVPLLLKITSLGLLSNAWSFLIHTPKISLLLSNSSSDLGLKLHGICKQDPLSASIFFGAVMKRPDLWVQSAKAPVNQNRDEQTVLMKRKTNYLISRWLCQHNRRAQAENTVLLYIILHEFHSLNSICYFSLWFINVFHKNELTNSSPETKRKLSNMLAVTIFTHRTDRTLITWAYKQKNAVLFLAFLDCKEIGTWHTFTTQTCIVQQGNPVGWDQLLNFWYFQFYKIFCRYKDSFIQFLFSLTNSTK